MLPTVYPLVLQDISPTRFSQLHSERPAYLNNLTHLKTRTSFAMFRGSSYAITLSNHTKRGGVERRGKIEEGFENICSKIRRKIERDIQNIRSKDKA